ncbi:DUF6448 family protein [Salinimicrobium terrae]|uniref:DUF6448 family protein n=1 Tax=Salinimicrobium terrae TaxID=470866 RepID=UPI0004192972|nr:DUF6448 family protein [Salinimicrobium terrae]
MKTFKRIPTISILFLLLFGITITESLAHCDRKNGPVAVAAREALQTENIDKILIWVGEKQEEELREKFQQSVQVYKKGGESKQLAEEYFMETSVRLHREAEGLPFTGLKDAQPNPEDIEAAENALDSGNIDPVVSLLSEEINQKVTHWFRKAREAKENRSSSIEAGREWVDTYVRYITYIHGLYQTIQQGPPHGVGE